MLRTRRVTTARPTAGLSSAGSGSRTRQRRPPVLPDRQICAIPTTGGGRPDPGDSPQCASPPREEQRRSDRGCPTSCLRTTAVLAGRDAGRPGCCYRPDPSVRSLGSARLLLFLGPPGPGHRNGDQPQLHDDTVLAARRASSRLGRPRVWSPKRWPAGSRRGGESDGERRQPTAHESSRAEG
jgi:hypothetical protein